MKNTHRAAAGAAALLAASLIGVGTANATAPICGPSDSAARITSVQQLKDSIAQAASAEKQGSVAPLAVHPMGGWTPPPSFPPAS
ncbi:MAG: hypothetical protein M3Y77_10535 [Actinomycetota bacterium]|nr:hypothetical protein [Actinomycetota bacterium]MDQ2958891.1 hypothetical protein [Actinomycetota bacterium]